MATRPKHPPDDDDDDDDAIVIARSGEPRLARATARAQARLPEFIEMLRQQPRGVRFFVKAAFNRSDGKGHKHMWVRVTQLDGDAFVGILDSDPHEKVAVSIGDTARIPVGDIEDWFYDRNARKRVGEFSAPVLDQIERENQKRR